MRPNILFITTDQHRWDFLGCSRGPACSPHIDNLAAEGVYFSNCITNAPVCAAARCSLATGIRPHRLGDNANATSLQPWHRTYYQQLRDSGYHVGCVGKLDLAKTLHDCGRDGAPPRTYSWGFTRPCDVEAQGYIGIHDYPVGPYGQYLVANGLWDTYYADMAERLKRWFIHDVHDNVLSTEHTHDSFIGRNALQWIREYREVEPWHLFVSFVGPHDPYNPPSEYGERWRNRDVPERVVARDGKPDASQRRFDNHDPEFVRKSRRQYCGKIELIDYWVGEMVTELKRKGEWENTYVIFSSDHGDMMGDHGLYTKQCPYEGAIHIPLIVRGPEVVQGKRSDALVELSDCGATVCDIAGVQQPQQSEAQSFLPVATGATNMHREFCISTNPGFACIRTGTHKYVRNDNDRDELYNVKDDPGETVNLLASDDSDKETKTIANELGRKMRRAMGSQWQWREACL